MSRRVTLFFLGALACLSTGFGPPVLTDADLPRSQLTGHQLWAMRRVAEPVISAEAALLVNTTTGEILYKRNERQRRAPASLTKIVTALVALRRGRQDEEMRIARPDIYVYTAAGLENGEPLTLRQLLFFLLIPSDNVAAMAIARELAEDTPTFVGWMNDLVTEWDRTDTHFVNPYGGDAENHYSTAYDLAFIAREAMREPLFREIVGHSQATVAGRYVESTNKLLNAYPGMIGIKTGTTDEAGECLIAMVDRPRGRMMSVVMGSTDRFHDTRLLLDYAHTNYAELLIDLPDTAQNRYLDTNNSWRSFRLKEPIAILVAPWQVNTVSLYRRIDTVEADPAATEPIGMLRVELNGRDPVEVPLYVR